MASANVGNLTKTGRRLFHWDVQISLVSSLPSESDLDTFDFRNDITNEVAASGSYATGGQQ